MTTEYRVPITIPKQWLTCLSVNRTEGKEGKEGKEEFLRSGYVVVSVCVAFLLPDHGKSVML